MKTAVILHGTLSSPNGNWFQWLKSELEEKDLDVWLPQLPHAEQPSLREWQRFVTENCPFPIDEQTLIVGHSSGAILALVLAQTNPSTIGAIVDVSVFHDNSLQWEPNNNLFDINFEWSAIRQGVNELVILHSDNDPYVPLEQAKYVAEQTNGELIVVVGEGHFNLEQGTEYTRFPRLLELLEKRKLI